MKIGIITDIHNNVIALKKVVKYLNERECDKVICCGDIIGIGPYPEETVQEMMKINNLICVCGNHEKYLTEGIKRDYLPEMHKSELEHHQWEHSLLSESSKDFLHNIPDSLDLVCDDIKIHVTHYALDSNNKCKSIDPEPTVLDLDRLFSYLEDKADIILYGHDHKGCVVKTEDKYYINCGSLGCPASSKNIARAGILNINNNNVEFKNISLEYDSDLVVDKINEIKYPSYELIVKSFYGRGKLN